MAKQLSGSRLLVKIATGLERYGPKEFEEKIDDMLVDKPTTATSNLSRKQRADYTQASTIINIVSNAVALPADKIKDGRGGEDVKYALSACVYFVKIKLQWTHTKIASFFDRKSHSFVNTSVDYINSITADKNHEIERIAMLKKIEKIIDNTFQTK